MSETITRRTFLGTTASAAVGASLVRSVAAKDAPALGANERINVGLIGCGSRGPYIAYIAQITPGVKLTAVCDVHADHMAAAVKQAEGVTGETPKTCRDYRKLIEDKEVDAIIIATPEHWHVKPAVDGCAAGKDVYLEKPVGTSIGEGRALVSAARKHERIIQMGTQQHSWEHYRRAVEIIQAGEIGEVSLVHVWDVGTFFPGLGSPPDEKEPEALDWDFWLGPAPRCPFNPNRFKYPYWFFDYGGAWQVAWGAHHYDIVHWAMGVRAPDSAIALGGNFAFADDNREWPDTFNGACTYAPGPVAKQGFLMQYTCRSGCSEPVMGKWHGKAFYGTDGMLVIDRSGFEIRPQVREGQKMVVTRQMGSTTKEHEVVQAHVANFFRCVRERERPEADIEVGHHATNPGHLMNISWHLGRRVNWDADKEQVVNDPEANRWLMKDYRSPWTLSV